MSVAPNLCCDETKNQGTYTCVPVPCLAMIQMQDVLDLGAEGRMNFPGTLSDSNWTWRVKDGIMTPGLAKKLLDLTKLYGRCGG